MRRRPAEPEGHDAGNPRSLFTSRLGTTAGVRSVTFALSPTLHHETHDWHGAVGLVAGGNSGSLPAEEAVTCCVPSAIGHCSDSDSVGQTRCISCPSAPSLSRTGPAVRSGRCPGKRLDARDSTSCDYRLFTKASVFDLRSAPVSTGVFLPAHMSITAVATIW
jgi:hypothetical protein